MNLRERALRFLARREHSRAELAGKLAAYGDAAEIVALLEQLEQEQLLSNARYADALARTRAQRHGSLRLQAELRDKGVPDALIHEVVAAARDNDFAAARAVWMKKFGALPTDAQSRAKQQRFLLGRGFPTDVIRRVLAGEGD